MRITIYMTDGTTKNDAMIENVTEDDEAYFTRDTWGDVKKYEKTKVALITVRN